MKLSSKAFKDGGSIPRKYTCDGEDISPPLAWEGIPAKARSLALIAEDPDAPGKTWVHWILYDLPPETRSLPENASQAHALPGHALEGMTDFKRVGYGGPCPPDGRHRYFFRLYALDSRLEFPEGVSRDEVLQTIRGHVLDEAQLMGTYCRDMAA